MGMMLSLAQVLSMWDMGAGLEFVSFDGEDCCGEGDEEYLRRYSLALGPVPWDGLTPQSRELDPILAVINADGVGQEMGPNTITTMGGSQDFDDVADG